MDDLKLIGRSGEELRKEIKIVKAISKDIKWSLAQKNIPEFI
jgi:hypothetical protein